MPQKIIYSVMIEFSFKKTAPRLQLLETKVFKTKVLEMSETPDAMVSVMELIEEAIGRVLLREIEKKKIGEKNNMMKSFKTDARVDNIGINNDRKLVKKEITNSEEGDKIDVQLRTMTVLECGRMNFNWQKVNTILEGQLV